MDKKNLPNDLYDIIAALTLKNKEQFQDIVNVVINALKEKDQYTQGHSVRVIEFSVKIGHEIGLNEEDIRSLEIASVLHDIGKLGVPDKILKKPGRLTKEEYQIMQQHSANGEKLLDGIKNLEKYKKYIRAHHERYDGFGYPDGLKGNDIPLISRIIFVADTFDAMTSDRPYRKGLPIEAAIDELIKCSGTQFDPYVVEAFLNVLRKEQEELNKEAV
ncbi:MAG: HD-GYP domain-containing protein [Proteobacteria bacterium]|nr:HD-GYP domain-containing protein [Pseudomonadota bacterium]